MLRNSVLAVALVMGLVAPARGQELELVQGAWIQTAPVWAVTAENPWTVMIFNTDGTFCGGAAKDNRYAEGTYGFDGELLTTVSSTGRLTERTVEFKGNAQAVWRDPQLDEPVVMVRTDMFADCADMRRHQGR